MEIVNNAYREPKGFRRRRRRSLYFALSKKSKGQNAPCVISYHSARVYIPPGVRRRSDTFRLYNSNGANVLHGRNIPDKPDSSSRGAYRADHRLLFVGSACRRNRTSLSDSHTLNRYVRRISCTPAIPPARYIGIRVSTRL